MLWASLPIHISDDPFPPDLLSKINPFPAPLIAGEGAALCHILSPQPLTRVMTQPGIVTADVIVDVAVEGGGEGAGGGSGYLPRWSLGGTD